MTRRLAGAPALAVLGLVPVADAAKEKVKLPKSGQYNGHPRGKDLTLYVNGNSIDLAAFSFKCADTSGRMSLNEIRLKKTSKGYKFGENAHGSITFADDKPDENGKVSFSGRFTPSGKKAAGIFRVQSPRCHDTGKIKWAARR
jgi:hypothetical protein